MGCVCADVTRAARTPAEKGESCNDVGGAGAGAAGTAEAGGAEAAAGVVCVLARSAIMVCSCLVMRSFWEARLSFPKRAPEKSTLNSGWGRIPC